MSIVDRLDMLNIAAIARYWTSPAYLSEYMETGTRVVLSQHVEQTVVLMMMSSGTTPDNPIVTVKEVDDLGPRFRIQVTFTVELATFYEAFQSLQQCVLIDGRAPMRAIDADLLHAVLS